jgi:hypothetical protein
MDLAVTYFMDRKLLLALEGLGHQVMAVDIDRPQHPAAQGAAFRVHG